MNNEKNTQTESNAEQIEKDNRPYIELNAFMKSIGAASTGGQAKSIIRSEAVKVNGVIDIRNKKKLHDKDVVEFEGKKYVVKV
jgi:ribosome-associated protein